MGVYQQQQLCHVAHAICTCWHSKCPLFADLHVQIKSTALLGSKHYLRVLLSFPSAHILAEVCRVSRSPFIARLRLPRFCSGFERHAFAPCDPQTLSFSAGSSYVVEPQLQLQCSPGHETPGQASGIQSTDTSLILCIFGPQAIVASAFEVSAHFWTPNEAAGPRLVI